MAIRYSGDVEVRLQYDPRSREYAGSVRDPQWSGRGSVSLRQVGLTRKQDPTSPDSYDRAALVFLNVMRTIAWKKFRVRLQVSTDRGSVVIRRTFQAPCPTFCR